MKHSIILEASEATHVDGLIVVCRRSGAGREGGDSLRNHVIPHRRPAGSCDHLERGGWTGHRRLILPHV
jgi:hypothetical protein